MTQTEALRLALSTLNEVREETFRLLRNGERLYAETKVWDTIYEIKKVLESKIEQEPLAWMTFNVYGEEDDIHYENPEGKLLEGWTYKPLYTHPPEWVGLTDEEIEEVERWVEFKEEGSGRIPMIKLVKCVETKLKEKNT